MSNSESMLKLLCCAIAALHSVAESVPLPRGETGRAPPFSALQAAPPHSSKLRNTVRAAAQRHQPSTIPPHEPLATLNLVGDALFSAFPSIPAAASAGVLPPPPPPRSAAAPRHAMAPRLVERHQQLRRGSGGEHAELHREHDEIRLRLAALERRIDSLSPTHAAPAVPARAAAGALRPLHQRG